MAAKIKQRATSGAVDDYEVGYGKPPKHTQFQLGRSGNPSGRRKGVRNLMSDVRRTLKVPVKVKSNGRSRNISTQEGALMLLREKALKGDARALDRLLELAGRFNNDMVENDVDQILSPDDRALLDAYATDIKGSLAEAATKQSHNDQAPRRKSRRGGVQTQ